MATARRTIEIPNGWDPRRYQLPLWKYLQDGGKRAVAVWHRRAGKDSCALNWTAAEAIEGRVGVYWHVLPTQRQARKVVWNNVDGQGRRVIDQVFPAEICKRRLDNEMLIELVSGSMWQLAGSDNYDSLVGGNPVGVVFSEWALSNPAAWDFVRPILLENNGWAIFIYTPRGRNHGHRLLKMAERNPNWFAQVLTVDDTGVIGPEAIQEERDSGMEAEVLDQEYYCSFEAALVGSYYGGLMKQLRTEGRIGVVPYDPGYPVHTSWDLGVGDATSIWFLQVVGPTIHVIDYEEGHGAGMDHYVSILQEKRQSRGFVYEEHWAPHDIRVREWGSGRTRLEQAADLGVSFRIAPKLSLDDGINATRQIIRIACFDESHCERGIDGLETYRKDWDETRQVFLERPVHDWASHPADALRTFANGYEAALPDEQSVTSHHRPTATSWLGA